ncbi:MAG: hypothetical protein PHW04_15135, partial [Candidatus Wallbacteria bacterium]|nr:hypothetical protein [Candidatus Wallbacteria bacterium]
SGLLRSDWWIQSFRQTRCLLYERVCGEFMKGLTDDVCKSLLNNFANYQVTGRLDYSFDYDEVWSRKCTEFLTITEVEANYNSLDEIRLYFYQGVFVCSTLLKMFESDPITKESFSKPRYEIIQIEDRAGILNKL